MRRILLAALMATIIAWLVGCAAPSDPGSKNPPAPQDGAQAQIGELEARIKEQEARTKEQEARIKEQEARIKEQEARIKEQEARIAQLQGRLASEPTPVNLISPHYPPAVAGAPGWKYHKTLTADLDSDGQAEKVSVTTNAEWIAEQNEFAWDDGHPWHVYVEETDGSRTYLFSNWVQLGRLEVILDREVPGLFIVISRGGGLVVYRATYRGPGQAETALAFHIPLSDSATWADPLISSK